MFAARITTAVLGLTLACVTATAAEQAERKALPDGALMRLASGGRLLGWLPDGKLATLGLADHGVHLWDPATGKELRSLPFPKEHKQTKLEKLSPDGKTLAFVSKNATENVVLWDLESGKQRALTGHKGIGSICWSPDGTALGASGSDGKNLSIRIWDPASGKERKWLRGQFGSLWALSAAGSLVVALDTNPPEVMKAKAQCDLCTIDSGSSKKLHSFSIIGFHYQAYWSPDGKTLAMPGEGSGVELLDPGVGRRIRSTESYSDAAVCWSPDGRMLASVSYDKVLLCDAASGKKIHGFVATKAQFLDVAFSPDGSTLATHDSSDGSVVIWKVPARQPAVKVSLDDRRLASLWTDLAGDDAAKADQATWTLAAAQDDGVKLLARKLTPAEKPDANRVARLIKDLDSTQFKVRGQARTDLEKLGPSICPALRKTLAGNPSEDVKKSVKQVLARLELAWPYMPLRNWRALAALERNGSEEAIGLLKKLAAGDADSVHTQEARRAVLRLEKLKALRAKK